MKKQNFPQQTHFIGVLTPEDITLTLEDCRRYMNEAYGCRSGHLTPIHVTLIPPFRLSEEYSTEDLTKVEKDEKWTVLRDAVYSAVIKAAPGCIKKDQRPFTPHLKKSGISNIHPEFVPVHHFSSSHNNKQSKQSQRKSSAQY